MTTILSDQIAAAREAARPTYVQYRALCGYTAQAQIEPNGEVFVSVLTPCCQAATKYVDTGVPGAPEVHVCKACHQEMPEHFGGIGYLALRDAAREAGCPDPEGCAEDVLWTLLRDGDE